jgi:phenylpropionate dioxygenase-like ring-hydroxylating dioxygenase large terminal subunit
MDQVRTIDAGRPPARFARGWHCLGLAGTFRDGTPHAVEAFGTKLAVFADSAGQLHVLDGYCRHMGGDLSQGTVKGDAIACPFHDWRWGGDGRCAAIPYARRVPVAARTRSWRTLERNGQLFVWHDPEGNPPPDQVMIPRIDGADSGEWTDWTWDSILVEGANCREVIDNVVDMAHFFYIHFAFPNFTGAETSLAREHGPCHGERYRRSALGLAPGARHHLGHRVPGGFGHHGVTVPGQVDQDGIRLDWGQADDVHRPQPLRLGTGQRHDLGGHHVHDSGERRTANTLPRITGSSSGPSTMTGWARLRGTSRMPPPGTR